VQSPKVIKLYAVEKAPMVQPVRMCLHEKQIEHELIYINPYDKPEWYKNLTPNGQGLVPTLQVDDAVIFESSVINEYLDEVFPQPRFLPSEPVLRAKNRAWTLAALEILLALVDMTVFRRREEYEANKTRLLGKLAKLEAQLGEGPYFNGEAISLTDFQYAPIFLRIDILDRLYGTKVMARFERLSTWAGNILSRPSQKATIPPPSGGRDFELCYLPACLDSFISSQMASGMILDPLPERTAALGSP
jgi:glutathione S-transferase